MNILFLTLVPISGFDEKQNIYSDLCRSLIELGHHVSMVCPSKTGEPTEYTSYVSDCGILKVSIGEVQKTGLIKKGINTILLVPKFKKAICSTFAHIKFDLIVYSTPPITLYSIVKYLKKRDHAMTYLLLKDIFPQNAVDLNMLRKTGMKGLIYRYFKSIEKKLYLISDRIGTMSKANTEYLLKHEKCIKEEFVEELPNSFYPYPNEITAEKKREIRQKYGLPTDKTILIYGGNLGKPQDVPFLCRCLKAIDDIEDFYTVICGNGTDYPILEKFLKNEHLHRAKLVRWLPREEYEAFVGSCDVGLIFLDYRFTIPNFPSRLLSYMHKEMPVLACTDTASDIKDVIAEGNFGWWCPSNSVDGFRQKVLEINRCDFEQMRTNAAAYLRSHYSSADGAAKIAASYERFRG